MPEIVTVQVGQGGNAIGARFWESICDEHEVDMNGVYRGQSQVQSERLGVFFKETGAGRHVPRCLIVDTDINGVKSIKSSFFGSLFDPNNFIHNSKGAANNFGRGYNAKIFKDINHSIRREVEQCDHIQGFNVVHTLGGGTGSGLGTRILQELSCEYSDRIRVSYGVFPSPRVSDIVVEPYNSVLALSKLADFASICFCMDNEALYGICRDKLKIPAPSYQDMNLLIARCMAGLTCCLRFPGQLNADLRKLEINMVPYPKTLFCMTSIAPLASAVGHAYQPGTVDHLVQQIFEPSNIMVACNPYEGKYMTAAAVFRGRLSIQEVEAAMMNYQNKNPKLFANGIPINMKTGVCDIAPRGFRKVVTFAANNTAITQCFDRLGIHFWRLFKKGAYVHQFDQAKITKGDMEVAYENVNTIKHLYNEHHRSDIGKGTTLDRGATRLTNHKTTTWDKEWVVKAPK